MNRVRNGQNLAIPFIFSFTLLCAAQLAFLEGSLRRDLGLGRVAETISLENFVRFFGDSFYLEVLWITIKVSGLATLGTLLLGYPVAYSIARMRSRFAPMLLAGIVVASFVTIVIKAYGLIIIFSGKGWLNRALMATGLASEPYSIFGTQEGIVIGLMQFTIGYSVLVLYSVIRTRARWPTPLRVIRRSTRGGALRYAFATTRSWPRAPNVPSPSGPRSCVYSPAPANPMGLIRSAGR